MNVTLVKVGPNEWWSSEVLRQQLQVPAQSERIPLGAGLPLWCGEVCLERLQ